MGKMRDSASLPIEDWSELIGRLSKDIDLDLDELARTTKALLRRRGVPGATALPRLALARGPFLLEGLRLVVAADGRLGATDRGRRSDRRLAQ